MNSSIPYVGQFSALSLNLDGINTLIPRGAFKVKRCSVVLTYAVATEVSVLGLQEPHVRTDEQLATASSIFVKKGFNLLTNFSPQGNGGAAVAWNITKWPKLVLSFAIEPRIIMAELANPDGQTIVVLSCHFSHVPSLRKAQWAKLHKARHLFQGKQVLMLADHNSLVVPQRDSDNPPSEDRGDIINARDVELQVLGDMGLSDTWEYVHWGDGTDNDPPPGYTHGYRINEPEGGSPGRIKPREGLRRLDRIHISTPLLPSISTLFTTFLAKSDHKAVVVSFAPPQFVHETPRWHCPTSFLEDDKAISNVADQLSNLKGLSPSGWFSAAHRLIGRFATDYQKQHRPPTTQDTNVLGLLLSSTRDRVSREGHAYLVTRGHHPVTESSAYSILVACYEKEVQDRTGSIHLQKLKGLLAEQEPSVKNQKERRVQIDKLMVQLRNRKKLGWVRDKTGQTLSVPKDIAKALNEHWTGVTTPPPNH